MISREGRPMRVLLVEDDAASCRLTMEAMREAGMSCSVNVVEDGVRAVDYLKRKGDYSDAPRPDLILLDLNLPRKNGYEVLTEIKVDPAFRSIPVLVLTTSRAEVDIVQAYALNANCYIAKPVDFEQFVAVMRTIESFWFATVILPPAGNGG